MLYYVSFIVTFAGNYVDDMVLGLFIFAGLLIVLLALGAYGRKHVSEREKGSRGEMAVSRVLGSLPPGYRVFNNVCLFQDGVSSQIDHVVVSVYGIFVIETKNYSGRIYGSEKSERWCEQFYGQKFFLYNPIRQNYSHVRALEKLSGMSRDRFIPVVVFLEGVSLCLDVSSPVIYISQLSGFITGHRDSLLSDIEVDRFISLLQQRGIYDGGFMKSHVNNIRQRLDREKYLVSIGVCPRCGGSLVERKGPYGSFIACGRYPKCKFVRGRRG